MYRENVQALIINGLSLHECRGCKLMILMILNAKCFNFVKLPEEHRPDCR